jgi:hypothetical protein
VCRGALFYDERGFVGLVEAGCGRKGAPALKDVSMAVFFSSLACLCGCEDMVGVVPSEETS